MGWSFPHLGTSSLTGLDLLKTSSTLTPGTRESPIVELLSDETRLVFLTLSFPSACLSLSTCV